MQEAADPVVFANVRKLRVDRTSAPNLSHATVGGDTLIVPDFKIARSPIKTSEM